MYEGIKTDVLEIANSRRIEHKEEKRTGIPRTIATVLAGAFLAMYGMDVIKDLRGTLIVIGAMISLLVIIASAGGE